MARLPVAVTDGIVDSGSHGWQGRQWQSWMTGLTGWQGCPVCQYQSRMQNFKDLVSLELVELKLLHGKENIMHCHNVGTVGKSCIANYNNCISQ